MSEYKISLPILILSLSSEMVSILSSRIDEQNISQIKKSKLKQDLVSSLFSTQILDEIFCPQDLYSLQNTINFFDTHFKSSPLRLKSGLDKLFKMMVMDIKKELVVLKYPEEIFDNMISLIDNLGELVKESPEESLINDAIKRFRDNYIFRSAACFNKIKQRLLLYCQNKFIKIVSFVEAGVQFSDGTFMIDASQAPPSTGLTGKIIRYNSSGEAESHKQVSLVLTLRYKRHQLMSRKPGIFRQNNSRERENPDFQFNPLRSDIAK